MSKQQAIETAIKGLTGTEHWLSRKEIKELPGILWEDELPERIIQGFYQKGNGILVATNKRLIFIDKGVLWGLRVEDFPYDKISSIEYSTGLILGELVIYTSGNRAKIEQVTKNQVREFAEYVRARITGIFDRTSTAASVTGQDPVRNPGENQELLAQLERLANLKEQGLLDETEFKAAKAKLLGL